MKAKEGTNGSICGGRRQGTPPYIYNGDLDLLPTAVGDSWRGEAENTHQSSSSCYETHAICVPVPARSLLPSPRSSRYLRHECCPSEADISSKRTLMMLWMHPRNISCCSGMAMRIE